MAKTLREKIKVMQAFQEGKKIRSRPIVNHSLAPSLWCKNENPTWDWSHTEYEIMPKEITRQILIDDIVSCSNNANDHGLADYHRYVTGSDVYPSDEGFEEK